MGVKDEDFDKIAKNQSDSSLYHLAGDSIVVNVLMAIFKEMLGKTEQAQEEKVVEEKIGPAFVLTPEQKALADRLRDPASKARSLNLLSFFLASHNRDKAPRE